MSAAAAPERDEGWDMASTVVGQKVARRQSAERPAAPAARPETPPQAKPAPRGNTVLLAVIGFVAVLLIGLLVLLYLNARG
jgi:hypothetical protein